MTNLNRAVCVPCREEHTTKPDDVTLESSQLRLGISPGLNIQLSLREEKSQTVAMNSRNQPLKFNPLNIHAAIN